MSLKLQITELLPRHLYIKSEIIIYFIVFQDVHVMIFIGFGFLMTFLRRYGYSAVSVNMLIAAFVIQWSMLIGGFIHFHDGKFQISVTK